MKRLWFKAKRYGWGWYPATWEGWLVLLVYLVFLFGDVAYFKVQNLPRNQVPFGFLATIAIYTVLLIYVCYRTGEKPRWRWGGKG